jgi:hypothetical protein
MAVLSLDHYHTLTGITSTDATRDAALTAILAAVDAAIKKYVAPFYPEPTTITDAILDAPPHNILQLPVLPVRSLTSLYLRWGADGDAALFTSDYLLTVNTDYYMPVDDKIHAYSRSGHVYRRGWSIWALERRWHVGRLAGQIDPARGAIKATFTAGPAAVPEDIELAAMLMTSLIYARRTDGAPTTSESWNGYSRGVGGPFTATAALASPDVAALLAPYATVSIG